jgi:hypothetical protein
MTAKSGAIGHKLCDSLWAALAISTPQAVNEYQETSNDFHKIAYAHVRHLALVELKMNQYQSFFSPFAKGLAIQSLCLFSS